jgi:hypothetical protein
MSAITWIIIVLIVVSILVTVTEVALRFGMLSKERGNGNARSVSPGTMGGLPSILASSNYTLDDLRLWGASLSDQERRAVCGADYIGITYAGV